MNPVKVAAVQAVVEQIWEEVEVVETAVPSHVSEMPMSDEECVRGAANRARAARELVQADFGVGLEGGVESTDHGLLLVGWVVIVSASGEQNLGGCPRLRLPEHIAQRVLAGEELGPVMDDIVGQRDVKKKGGAVGTLTDGIIMRQEAFRTAVAYAFSPFIVPHLYQA
ncbi:MAG: inosine/xanthosine triphosphatase [Chloroflexota bacterium]